MTRTSVEPGPPLAINLDRDDVTLLPFIYWPVTPDFPALSAKARAKLARYISTGGMTLFDTRDGDRASALSAARAGDARSRRTPAHPGRRARAATGAAADGPRADPLLLPAE